jgi:hypothetical protein
VKRVFMYRIVVPIAGAVVVAVASRLFDLKSLPLWTLISFVAIVASILVYGEIDWFWISVQALDVQAVKVTVRKHGQVVAEIRPDDVSEIRMDVRTTLKTLKRNPSDWPAALKSQTNRFSRPILGLRLGTGYSNWLTFDCKDGRVLTFRIDGNRATDIRKALVDNGFPEPQADLSLAQAYDDKAFGP